ncbi:MAG: tetratricopeptide repeat protein [Desulfovibrio sp.]|uniref:tetratricopeptide repeat protein n=1 Tax=Desulfovibrio sp. TaxID=885 RepID=UPI00135D0F31|nr:tetratricopeptide repeat protein [Desulfovibrio sp.]MTJ92520.1 tetratricopeptide repeat protein [Desulfovibrio sp.]
MKRNHVALLCALALTAATSFSLLGCGGCSGSRHQAADKSDAPAAESSAPADTAKAQKLDLKGVSLRPVEAELSPNALNTYAFLVFAQAMNNEDDNALAAASPLLAKAHMPVNIWLEGGVWLLSRKSPHAAMVMEQALSVWPDDISLNLLYAEALMEKGSPELGVKLMREYLKKHPESVDARMELALLLVKSKQYPEAEKLLNSVTGKQRTPLVDYYHARALIGMDRPNEAVTYLQRAIKDMPDFVEAMAELAFIYEQKPDLKAARGMYEKLLKLNFSTQDVLLRLVNISLRMGQPEKALKYMQQGPESTPFRLTVASMFMDSRHFLQAESLLKQIVAQGDAPMDVYLLLAELAYDQRRDLDLAFSWLDKIPATSKAAVRGEMLRVQLLTEAGRDAEALGTVRKAAQANPDSSELVEVEVRLLARQKQMKQALETAQKAAKRWPNNAEMCFLLGSLQDETGDKKAAFKTMEQLLALHPDNYQALNYVGYTLAEENRDLDRAMTLLVRANEIAPNQSYIVDSLAWAYYKAGKIDDALKEIRRAVTLDEHTDASIWEHYGDIAARAGLKDEARTAYQKAMELKPDNAEALRQRLSNL